MGKKHEISDDDKTLFRAAIRGTKPLISSKVHTPPPKPARKKRQPEMEKLPPAPLSDYEKLAPIGAEETITYSQPGIAHKTLRKLSAGQYNVEAILDLHGMTVDQAKEALYHFLLSCQRNGKRYVLVIHGKGRNNVHPVLKNKLNLWLRQMAQVLAFCSAAAKDGRSGSMYVLLKQGKGEILL